MQINGTCMKSNHFHLLRTSPYLNLSFINSSFTNFKLILLEIIFQKYKYNGFYYILIYTEFNILELSTIIQLI